MWGLFVLAPILQHYVQPALRTGLGWIPGIGAWLFTETVTRAGETVTRPIPLTGRDMFCGGVVLAIMILPIITAISRDVLKSVPRAQIEGTLALGATWWQSSREMLRYSRSGLFGAVMLGLARAAGETMAITMVIGNSSRIHASLFAPAQTMSSLLANEFAEASSALHRAALTEVALILLLMSLMLNVVARWLVVGASAGSAAAH
jgi:phosphate transport system permease protein